MMAATFIGATGFYARAADPSSPDVPSLLMPEETEADFSVPSALSPWFREFTFRTAAGYKDNVSLAHVSPVGSAFISTGLEAIASRLPLDGKPQWDFFVIFDDIRYLTPDPVEKEQLGFAHAQIKQEFGGSWETSLGLDYIYQDQVIDASVTEANLTRIQIQAHGIVARPGLQLNVTPHFRFGLEFPITRQLFAEPLSDYWEMGPKVIVGATYGHKSDLTLSYQSQIINFDTSEQLDRNGVPIPDTHRNVEEQEVRLQWRHHWDEPRRWRTTAKLGYRTYGDTGVGYLNFQKPYVSGQLLYHSKTWECRAEARFGYYDYKKQPPTPDSSATRQRQEAVFNLRAEKQLATFLKVFAEYEHEQTYSNDALEEYDVNIITAGLNWTF